MKPRTLSILALLLGCGVGASVGAADPFLRGVYDSLHDSPRQRLFREIAPMPLGSVYIQRPGDGEVEMRWHFRTMRELGYTALKQVMLLPGVDQARVAQLAIDEGISPWWYGDAGWAPLTAELRGKLGLPANASLRDVRDQPQFVDYQRDLYRSRANAMGLASNGAGDRPELSRLERYYFDKSVQRGVPDFARGAYVDWCRAEYGTLEAVSRAHNRSHTGLGPVYKSWADVGTNLNKRDFARLRDEYRFRADGRLSLLVDHIAATQSTDPLVPFRRGGEIGLFMSMPLRGVDMEAIADLMTPGGCFYPSVHLEWHFDLVEWEITRPVYMHASWITDLFKGGWTFGVETTGGPQQHSGAGQAFTVDDGTMTQLMLSYLAGGFRGFGIWCWNSRSAGLEAGEYALLGRNNEITERARAVGRIGQAARRWRDELWDARKEPLVGVFYDWDSAAIWTAMSVRFQPEFAFYGTKARIGASRALINGNVPLEYVTADDLRNGLAGRYRVIYLPAVIALNDDLWSVFERYVAEGGRLVIDMPGAHTNARAELIPTGRGSRFEKLFGVALVDHQGAGVNRDYSIDGMSVSGWVADLAPTSASVLARFDNGDPAVTVAEYEGGGACVLIGYEASRSCFKSGSEVAENALLRFALGDYESPYRCDEALVYRLAGAEADHYFLVNDGPEVTATLSTDHRYSAWSDAVSGQSVEDTGAVTLPANSGRWLRARK